MLDKYRRPDYKVHAKTYHAEKARFERFHAGTRPPDVRFMLAIAFACVATIGLGFFFAAGRLGAFSFQGQPIVQGQAVIMDKRETISGGGTRHTLRVRIESGRFGNVDSDVLVDKASFDSVVPGQWLHCAFRRSRDGKKAMVLELAYRTETPEPPGGPGP